MSDDFLLTLPPVTPASASDAARPLLESAQRESGMIPNMYARMVNAPALLATYQDGYARFRAESGFTAAEQEVVFLAISREHECAYCVAAHSFLADAKSELCAALRSCRVDRTLRRASDDGPLRSPARDESWQESSGAWR